MYTGINFLKERNRVQELVTIRDRKIATITGGVLGVFLLGVFALFFYGIFLRAQVAKVTAALADETNQYQQKKSVEQAVFARAKKIDTIGLIYSKRSNKWEAIRYFYGVLPQGASINAVDLVTDVTNELRFTLVASDVNVYQSLLTLLSSPDMKKNGYTFELGAMSRVRNGTYNMEVTVIFGTDATAAKKK